MTLFSPPKKVRQVAFSLLEMLIAVSIIGLLASLIVPKAKNMLEYAQGVKCMNSLKNIGAAMSSYAADNDGKFPAAGSKASGSENLIGNWYDDIAPYFGKDSIGTVGQAQMNKIYETVSCPTFVKKYKNRPIQSWVGYGMNNRLNLAINDTVPTTVPRLPMAAIPSASKTVLIGEGSGFNLDLATTYTFTKNSDLEGWKNGGTPDRHGGHSNYLFVDGHIASLKKEDAEAVLRPRLEQ